MIAQSYVEIVNAHTLNAFTCVENLEEFINKMHVEMNDEIVKLMDDVCILHF